MLRPKVKRWCRFTMVYVLDTGEHLKNPFNIQRQLLYKIEVTLCANCVCQYCANNVEELWNKVQPGEVKEPCLNCDECYEFTGSLHHERKSKENCGRFILSDYGADRNRKYIKLVKENSTKNGSGNI